MEMGKDEIAVVLMEPVPVSRLKTQYRSLRRQVYFFQFISVLLCFICCLFTVMYHSYPSTCKENGTVEAPKTAMQHQNVELHSSEEMTRTQRITRLTVKPGNLAGQGQGHVPWMHTGEPIHNGYFTFDEDSNSLMVLRDGTYKVSLQITYRGVEGHSGTFILQHDIYHNTTRYNKSLPLLTYMETVNFTSPYWRKSLFSEGIFFLEKGDRLKVWTNSLSLIDVGDKLAQKAVFVVYPHFST